MCASREGRDLEVEEDEERGSERGCEDEGRCSRGCA